MASEIRRPSFVVLLALLLFAVLVIRAAWLSDDAYITFRVVENATAGLGLRWNAAERVQAYTHPLWLLALLAGRLLSGELYYTSLGLSVALSLVAAGLVAFRLRAGSAAALGVLVLCGSRAFVEYSTSGLENPLSHFLLAAFLVVWFTRPASQPRILLLSFLAGLLALSRTDSLLIVLPALLLALWRARGARALLLAAAGFLPLVAWTAFSLAYYGFPAPNTAYAKLDTGIAAADLARQGLAYLVNSLRWDPLTLTAAGAAVALSLAARRRDALAIAAGIALYLVYVVRIGGDFMTGRFLALPLLAAVALLVVLGDARLRGGAAGGTTSRARWGATAALIIGLALAGYVPVWRAGSPTGDAARRDGDIADERAYYLPNTGLFAARVLHPWAEQGLVLRAAGPAVIEHGNVGFLGYYAGPAVHIIDRNGLTDPLLARLPVRDPADWRAGHYRREVPVGYADTLRGGQNVIQNPSLAAFYEPLRLATRGPLWDRRRLVAIWRLNTGYYDDLLPEPGAG